MSEVMPDRGVEHAFGYAWTRFVRSAGTWLVAALVWVGAAALVQLVWTLVVGGLASRVVRAFEGPYASPLRVLGAGGYLGLLVLLALVGFLLVTLVQGALARGALAVTQGRGVALGTFAGTRRLGALVVAGLLVAALATVGLVLCYLPALVVGVLTQFTVHFVLGTGLGPVAALRASVALVRRNPSTSVVLFVVSSLTLVVGVLACGVGVLVAVPVVALAQAHVFRTLLGEPVDG
jgi:uncharacterized membrane protein